MIRKQAVDIVSVIAVAIVLALGGGIYLARFGDMLLSSWLSPRYPEIVWGVWGAVIGAVAGLHIVDRKLGTGMLSRMIIHALLAAMLILAVCGLIIRR